MILITGGAWQGKHGYAVWLAEHGGGPAENIKTADGQADSYEAAFECTVIRGFHSYVRRLLREEKNVDRFINDLIRQNPEVIITSDEIGCGIVPISAEERAWREAAGRAQARLAAESSRVYRLICGIPQQLK